MGQKKSFSQNGSVIIAIFGAIAAVGVVGAATMNTMKGPVRSMHNVTQKTIAENNMIAAGKLALMAAIYQENGGDCDEDGTIEPLPFSSTGEGSHPTGGGYLPQTIGTAKLDPWGNEYGYCVWDHGTSIHSVSCGSDRLRGAEDENGIVLAVISSGPDRVFQTSCGDAPDYVVRGPASDDIVLAYSYAEAATMTGGLWNLKAGAPSTAQINKDIEVHSSSGNVIFGVDSITDTNRPAIKVDYINRLANNAVEFLSNIKLGSSWLSGDGDNEGIFIDNGGNVGVGTNNPAARLDVRGVISGGFGALGTGGVLDWNDVSNTRSGSSPTLLLGNATNGPSGTATYFHAFNFEYGAKDGTGQITQLAIPYSNSTAQSQGIYMRGRYSGTWSPWKPVGDNLGNHTATQALNLGAHAITANVGTIRDAGGGWVRTHGATGWYSQTYGGGWYMTDATYLRSYGTKAVLAPSYVDANDSAFLVDPNGTSQLNVVSMKQLMMDYTANYDVWIQGGTATSGEARNLALLGRKSDDRLYLNHASEYTGGTVIGGPVTVQGTLNATGGISGFTEVDPKVGALTNNRWCYASGGKIICDRSAPLTGFTEVDPKVGAITSGRWCRGSGSQVICDQAAPTGGGIGETVPASTVCSHKCSSYATFDTTLTPGALSVIGGKVGINYSGSGCVSTKWMGGCSVTTHCLRTYNGAWSSCSCSCSYAD